MHCLHSKKWKVLYPSHDLTHFKCAFLNLFITNSDDYACACLPFQIDSSQQPARHGAWVLGSVQTTGDPTHPREPIHVRRHPCHAQGTNPVLMSCVRV